jgi:hypothetical protein
MITQAEFIARTGTITQAIQEAAYQAFGHAPSTYYMPAAERLEMIEFIAANPANVHTKQYIQAGDDLQIKIYYIYRDANQSVYRYPTITILPQPE